MRKILSLFLIFGITFFVTGCYTTGLSTREKGSFNYSNLIYGLYKENNAVSRSEMREMRRPIKLAIAQVGEATPPKVMLDHLVKETQLISEIVVLPAGGNENSGYQDKTDSDPKEFHQKMQNMRELAKDLGADYIFLFGGSIDSGAYSTWLQLFDLTLVGAFVIPSVVTEAEGRAFGALIDVQSGRVIFTVNAEAKEKKTTPSYMVNYQADERVLVTLRNDLVIQLSEKFLEKLSKEM